MSIFSFQVVMDDTAYIISAIYGGLGDLGVISNHSSLISALIIYAICGIIEKNKELQVFKTLIFHWNWATLVYTVKIWILGKYIIFGWHFMYFIEEGKHTRKTCWVSLTNIQHSKFLFNRTNFVLLILISQ